MFSIAIIGDIHDWHSEQIEFNLKKKNYKVIKIKYDDLNLIFDNRKNKILSPKLPKLQGVWTRFLKNGSLEEVTTKLTFLHLLQEMGVYIHNSGKVIEQTVDKVRTTGLLNINRIPTPKTIVGIGNTNKIALKKKSLIKPIFGSQGKNIELLNTDSNLKKIKAIGNVYYIQEFLRDKKKLKFWDLRVLVSNHKIISIMKRTSNKFITNVYQGAQTKKIEVNEKLAEIAKSVSKLFKLGYGGIDIILHNGKYYVLEVNSIPSWKAIQCLEKKDISKILVNDFLVNLKKNAK